jgi:hypothetical protein
MQAIALQSGSCLQVRAVQLTDSLIRHVAQTMLATVTVILVEVIDRLDST